MSAYRKYWAKFRKYILLTMAVFVFQVECVFAVEPVLLVGSSLIRSTYDYVDHNLFEIRWVGGWRLDHHFDDSQSRSMICDGHTFVVLQEFSNLASNSSQFERNLDEMIPYVRSCEAVPVLFMNWESNYISYGTIRNAYEDAVEDHDVQMVAVGTVWNRIRASNENLYQEMLHPDGKHATNLGDRVNAASLYKAFCSSCYQSFNWSGFSSSEITLIRSVIEQYIDKVVLPPPPEEPNTVTIVPMIYQLLLVED